MSRGPGQIEQRIGDLFAASRDRALSVSDITDHAFTLGGKPATRAQRLSATRAAHRVLRRAREADAKDHKLTRVAHNNTKAALGRAPDYGEDGYDEYQDRLKADPLWPECEKLRAFVRHIGAWHRLLRAEQRGRMRIETDFWCTTALPNRQLYFHPPDVPVRVWAVTIDRSGVHWFDAEVTRVTARNVMVRYAGEAARLDRRQLWYWWAFWRGVRFVSSRTGRIAAELDQVWWERYGHASGGVPPAMQMPLADAIALLGVSANYTREEVMDAFRRAVKLAHPDRGGTAEVFHKLVAARKRLLVAIGTSAPAPKMPAYYPSGMQIRYGSGRSSSNRLGYTRRLAHG